MRHVPFVTLAIALACAGLTSSARAQAQALSAQEGPGALGPTTALAARASIKPGQILIKLARAPKTAADAEAALASIEEGSAVGLRFLRLSVLGWLIAEVDATTEEDTAAAVAHLSASKLIAEVQTVGIKRALRTPNDPRTSELWGFDFIGMREAWDTTVGTASQRIGIVDTGIKRSHVELSDKDVFGFDFISDPSESFDGDGRDPDPNDDDVGGSFHGSHVAGTMAASADNGVGVPGVNWNAKLVTARALSTTAGNTIDVDEGAFWLAGGDVPNVPPIGADRVSVINLSLGSDAPCTGFERDVMAAIIASGVTVVASAGNSGNNLPAGSPASCPGVISVGAYNAFGELTSYTNFATPVVVMAPGGEGFANDPSVDILSVDGATTSGFKSIDGTSMAAPHVTGVVSLMQAINPQLSPRQIKALMDEIPFTCVGCNNAPALDAPTLLDLAASTAGEMTTLPPPPGSGSNGGGQCPPHSTLDPNEGTCFCDAGFHVNAQQTGCVADSGGSGGGGGGQNDDVDCPAHASFDASEDACFCDDGFDVNDAGTGCVRSADDGQRDDGSDRESRLGNSYNQRDPYGCASTGAPTSATIAALGMLLLLLRRRSVKHRQQ